MLKPLTVYVTLTFAGMLRPRGPCGLEAKSFGRGLGLGLKASCPAGLVNIPGIYRGL